ncbi:hypothetical protein [Microbispora bryophytorum]|uniref:hypothetical protein n=1 Tax=Microbispora bryophytorum TaxID=1460882 RepID=UPI0033DE49EB
MPRTLSDPPPGVTYEEEYVVTVMWEPDCECDDPDCECDDPDCDPEVGEWMAVCGDGDFLVMAPDDRHAELWALAERYERDPRFGVGTDRLPDE